MTLKAPTIANSARPGQFITIGCGKGAFLKRPMGLSHADTQSGEIGFIYQSVGLGTNLLKEKRTGEEMEVIGPLGNYFWLEKNARSLALVGGGTGVGPLILAAKWIAQSFKKIDAYTFIGTRNSQQSCGEEELREYSKELFLATDDGTKGQFGLVTDVFKSFLKERSVNQIITCGPSAMMKRISELAAEYTIPAQASLEEYMACGFGACLGCPCETKEEGYKMICVDGPIFDTQKIVWK